MTGRLQDKVVLLTGAASGIGAATVALMLREGATVLATDIDPVRGQALVDSLAPAASGRIEFLRLDVAQEPQWEHALARLTARFGPLDVLVNNAGVAPQLVTLAQTSLEEWRRVMSINLDGTFLGVKHAIRAMTGRGGAIVNISSVAGLVGMPLNGAYSPAKAGVLLLTKCAALECSHLEPPIRVNAVHPGYIRTDMTGSIADTLGAERFERRVRQTVPLKKLGDAADIAEAIVFLACEQSKFTTGSSLVVDGGWTAQ
ncbi:MAG: SDR family oxidoreductase [Burkholderiaceae bacterium]|jgi:3(or 17)beta-hydroxysteroid dehydrogenase|nr:SDR family oxidoreductase [Burkholderiaceae bacterium]